MPLYEFSCCGKTIERYQGLDKETPICPDCGMLMERLISPPAIIRMVASNGTPAFSKGYKDGYSKEYLRSLGRA